MTEQHTPKATGREKFRAANYFRTGVTDEAGEARFEVRLYIGGKFETSMSVTSTNLQSELDALRLRGYAITRVEL